MSSEDEVAKYGRLAAIIGTPLVVLCVVGVLFKNRCDDRDQVAAPSAPTIVVAPDAFVPLEREPVFGAGADLDRNPANIAAAEIAERAVYERCKKFFVFREGSTLTADFVPARFSGPWKSDMVNVSVKLFTPERASGNTLWYGVLLTKGKPSKIWAVKDVSANLCALPADEQAVDL